MREKHKLISLEQYKDIIGDKAVKRIMKKADKVKHLHITHINSTYYGGGVAELLSSLALLMNCSGIKTGWRIIQGSPDFFSITKKFHNALQGDDLKLSKRKKEIYEEVIFENAVRNHLDHDLVIIHDPQALPLIEHYRKKGPWIWQCHVDLTKPNIKLWKYFKPFIEKYDAAIFSLKDYKQKIKTPQRFFMPAIDPFSIKNRYFTKREIDERLNHYDIPTDLPLVVQISRFDQWKDPEGTIKAFQLAQKKIKARLVLLGNIATDDPGGSKVYESLLNYQNDMIRIISQQDTALVNALQRKAAVVVQKSIREGFGLTVTEAMWKGTPVIGGNVGGIRYQIKNGVNGYLVSSVEETAQKIIQLIENPKQRNAMGAKARESVKNKFLMARLLEQYLDLFNSFETIYQIKR